MASLIPAGNAAGTGSMTIQAPATNSNQTLNLPDASGTMALTTSGTPVADCWYLNAIYTSAADVQTFITANLSQLNLTGTAVLGSMTQSSGVFTFPQTGLYRVAFATQFYSNANIARYCFGQINVSTDGGSTYSIPAVSGCSIDAIVAGSNTFQSGFVEVMINVNNTSNIKVKFSTNCTNNINVNCTNPAITTYMTFTRLGNSV